jgi:hypothetical protein
MVKLSLINVELGREFWLIVFVVLLCVFGPKLIPFFRQLRLSGILFPRKETAMRSKTESDASDRSGKKIIAENQPTSSKLSVTPRIRIKIKII